MCSFHSRSAYYSACTLLEREKEKQQTAKSHRFILPKVFTKQNSNAGNSALTWTLGMTKKNQQTSSQNLFSLRYRESSLTPNTYYPHSLSLTIQDTTGDALTTRKLQTVRTTS